ncbi:MAG: hypothetical protein WDW36_001970 [Sanguina aurantia]
MEGKRPGLGLHRVGEQSGGGVAPGLELSPTADLGSTVLDRNYSQRSMVCSTHCNSTHSDPQSSSKHGNQTSLRPSHRGMSSPPCY